MTRENSVGALRAVIGRRAAVYAMVTVGGSAALSWELIWQLQASLAIGASARAAAVVLASTMVGMAVGSWLAGRWMRARPPAHPLRAYGLLELVIGISGLAVLSGFDLLEAIDSWVYGVSPILAPIAQVLGITALLGPPTVAMGATIPAFQLVAQATGARVSVLYGLNTAGASLGVLLLSFALLPAFGVAKMVSLVAALNLAVFAGCSMIGVGASAAEPVPPADARAPVSGTLSRPLARWIAFSTGFATFGLEVAWFRSMRSAYQSTTDSFAIMLASVLIPLAIGANLVPWIRRRGTSLGVLLLLAGSGILLATPLVERMDLFAPDSIDYLTRVSLRLGLALAIVGPAMLFLGIALPWALEEFPEAGEGGRLYALNTSGAVLGSLVTAWVLLPNIGFASTAWGIGLWIASFAFFLVDRKAVVAAAAAASLAIAVTQTSKLGRDRVQSFDDFGPYRILGFTEGPDSTISVLETVSGAHHLLIDGFVASTEMRIALYMEWMGHLPMLLHPAPKNALVICFGTGRTANAVRQEGPDHLDIVDINRGVLDLAGLFPANERVLEDERVEARAMDGRAWLRRSGRTYDVVTMEPMPPNFAGVNALYSKEFYEIVRANLSAQGVFAQWLPIHLVTPEHAEAIAATFMDVFPDAVLWTEPSTGTGILLGRKGSEGQPLGSQWPGLARSGIERPMGEDEIRKSVALDRVALERYVAGAGIITDDNQLLAYGHHFIDSADHTAANTEFILEARGSALHRTGWDKVPVEIDPRFRR